MSLSLLKHACPPWQDDSVIHYLLLPLLPDSVRNEQLIDAVILSNLWRIRRDRPYVVAYVEDETRTTDPYVQSLETRRIDGSQSPRPFVYVGMGDVSPLVPRTEDDMLILFRDVPPRILPSWPRFIVELGGVQITRADEYVKISTISSDICEVLDELPHTPE